VSDDQRLHEMLEKATAPGSDLPVSLDAETASLREAWLALGRTLDAAEAAAGPPRELVKLTPPTPPGRQLLPPATIFALAASLLVAATIALLGNRGPKVADRTAPQRGNQTAPLKTEVEVPTESQNLTYWEWDEQVDTEIENVARGANWRADYVSTFSMAYSALGEDIVRIEEDINDGKF